MININRFQANTFILSLYEDITYSNPFYIFEWVDVYNRKVIFSIPDDSSIKNRYNKFTFVDSSISSRYLQASGKVNVYESLYDASIVDASMNLLYTDDYRFFDIQPTDIVFDPSIITQDYVFDPSAIGQYAVNQDFVFDPVFAEGGASTPYNVNAWQIGTNENYRFINDACIFYINNTLATKTYVNNADTAIHDAIMADVNAAIADQDTSIFNATNSLQNSINNQNNYLTSSIAIQDASILLNKTNQDTSILTAKNNQDTSIYDFTIYTNQRIANQDASILQAKNNQDTSISDFTIYVNQELNYQDASILWITQNFTGVNAIYVDGSLAFRDTSIYNIYTELNAYATNASVNLALDDYALTSYVDSSLAARDVSIEWLKVNAVGTPYTYVDPSLTARDVSIEWLKNNKLEATALYPYATNVSVNASLLPFASNSSVNIALYPYATNASVATALLPYATNVSVNNAISSINQFATNVSVNNALTAYSTTSQINTLILPFATNVSVNNALLPYATNVSTNAALNNKLDNTTDTFTGVLTVNGSLYIVGDLFQDGSTYIIHGQNINTYADFITMREGAVLQLPDGSIAGIKIIKANGTNNVIFGTNNDAVLRVGWENDALQAIATREDNPIDKGYAYWDNASTMFKTVNLNSSFIEYATNVSTNAALVVYATNVSTNAAISIVNNEFAKYIKGASTGTGLYWVNGNLDVSIASVASLVQLTDVSIVSISANQILAYDASTSKWKNKTAIDLSVYDVVDASNYFWLFSDVSLTSPSNNQALVYDTSINKFKNMTINASMYEIVNASDYVQSKITYNSPSTGAAGTPGAWCYDVSYLYICSSTNLWGRIQLITGY